MQIFFEVNVPLLTSVNLRYASIVYIKAGVVIRSQEFLFNAFACKPVVESSYLKFNAANTCKRFLEFLLCVFIPSFYKASARQMRLGQSLSGCYGASSLQ